MVGSSKGSVNLPMVQSEPVQAFRLLAGSDGLSVGAIAGNGGESGGRSCADKLDTAGIRRIIPQATTTRARLEDRIVGSSNAGSRSGIATKNSEAEDVLVRKINLL